MKKWEIGDVTITSILEWESDLGVPGLIPLATPEAVKAIDWLRPDFATDKGDLKMSLQAFVVETPRLRVMVDTCIGNDKDLPVTPMWHQMQTSFLSDLTAAGFPPDSINAVLCTHLHADHVGWNTRLVDGKWIPTFPNARYLFGRTEHAHLLELVSRGSGSVMDKINANVLNDSVRPIVAAGLAELVDTDHRLCPEISFVPTPGHTPGHVSVLITSKGQEALITGDFVHHPCQVAHPHWNSVADEDKEQSIATRKRVFSQMAGTPSIIIGSHWTGATGGTLARNGEGFRLIY